MRDPADVRRVQRPLHHEADLVVVDAQRCGHREGGEDTRGGQPLDRSLLEPADVGAPVVGRRRGRLPVVLQVDLDPLAVLLSRARRSSSWAMLRPLVLISTRTMLPGGDLVEQLGEPRVERRLAAGQHEHVDPAVLAGEPGVDDASTCSSGATDAERRARLGEAGRAPQVAVVGAGPQQDARVLGLHLRQPVLYAAGTGGKLPRRSGMCIFVGAVHCSRYREDLRRLVVQRAHQPVVGQPRSSQIRPSRSTSQPDSRRTVASGRSGRSSWHAGRRR